ncbi:MAG: nuclear transport factor 2 family protein [Gemmatimonadota bacterium]|nr:nuclear transport factor 2 family protein [Gemmatimonadota bacterium]
MPDFTDQDAARLRSMVDTHVRAIVDHDPDAFVATCGEDIVFFPPGEAPVRGKAACRQFLEDFPTPSAFTAEVGDADGVADLGFTSGRVTGTFEDGTEQTMSFVAVHRRQADGSWRMIRDIWN